jgi:hypothetical protein
VFCACEIIQLLRNFACVVFLVLCINWTLGFLQKKHLTNGDQLKGYAVTAECFLDDLCFPPTRNSTCVCTYACTYVLNSTFPMKVNVGPGQSHCTRPRHKQQQRTMTWVTLRKPDTRTRPPNTKVETTLTAMKVNRAPSGYMHHTSPVSATIKKGTKRLDGKRWRGWGGGGAPHLEQ